MVGEFKNEKLTDFSKEEYILKMEDALSLVDKKLQATYPLYIGGEKIWTEEKFISNNPSEPREIIGYFSKAKKEHIEKAINSALKSFEEWKRVSPSARARILLRAASIMRRRKFELIAWMILEAGKNWVEADADVCEAIDFLEFYARLMFCYSRPQLLTRIEGEDNELYYIPLGVGAVIPPWNFPLAILTGMTSAAIVSGNTVLLKPASTTPAIAYRLVEIFEEAGLLEGVLNFVPASGSEIGDFIVSHPKIRFIAFTGSKEVGLRINELAGKTQVGQIWIKRVILEMGGKDSIIVDSSADIENAVDGIITSAFGFQGQKCSACSRAIVVEDVYDEIIEKTVKRALTLTIGPPRKIENFLGPVISAQAEKTILDYIEIGKKEGKLLCGGEKLERNGYFIKPTIFSDVPADAIIAQEEIFGPVLAFIKAKDFDHALKIANNTEYGLTGSVYSRNRKNLEKAREEFFVGNLYFNRKCTGALVGAHPFGGFNMSGTDSKAGGKDYLLLFTQAKVVSEKF